MRLILLCILLISASITYSAKLEPGDNTLPMQVESQDKFLRGSFRLPAIKELEMLAGRKLTLKEKIGYFVARSKFKKKSPVEPNAREANSNAVLGFVFALSALFILPLFAIPALIFAGKALRHERESPGLLTRGNKSLARAAQVISYVSLVFLLIALIIVISFLATWGR